VLVDYRDPTVTAVPPKPGEVIFKKPIMIELAAGAADEGGIERVEYYLVGQDKTRLDEEDLVKKNLLGIWRMNRPRLEENFARPVPYNTEKLEVGTYWVWAVAVDRAKRKSLETRLGSFRVNEPAPEGDKKVAGVTVKGQAVYLGVSRDGITVTLSTTTGQQVATATPVGLAAGPMRPEFSFEFKDVPPGTYVLTAQGTEQTPAGKGAAKKLRHSEPLKFEVKSTDKGMITVNPLKLTTDR
jgi:hypothetical protein